MRPTAALLRKELTLEWRTREAVPAMALFSVTTFVVLHFGLQRDSVAGSLAAGMLWVTLLFAAMLGANRLFVSDAEGGALDGILLAPIDRTSLYLAKAVAFLGFLAIVEVVAVPAFYILLLGPAGGDAIAPLLGVLLLADIGIALTGTLVAGIATQTRSRDLLVSLIGLPLLIPVIIAAARATTPLFAAAGAGALPGKWLAVLGLYDVIIGLIAIAVFDFLLEDALLRPLSILTALTLTAAYALAFFYAPMDAVEGVRQKIFYLHVPLAIVALCGFVAGGVLAIAHLRTGDRKWDLRSYVAIHMALIFGIGALITGSIWARAAWGHWWLWDEPLLVSFLIVFLLYACYQPLRFAIEDPERQARYASVFAVVAGAFVPINFAVVRLAQENTHPRTLSSSDNLPGEVWLTFLVALAGMTMLYITLCKYEMTAKRVRGELRKLRRRLGQDVVAGRSAAPQ